MSLLLVLSQVEFKLDMEVRATSCLSLVYPKNLCYCYVCIYFQNVQGPQGFPPKYNYRLKLCSTLITVFGLLRQNCSFLDESWVLPVSKGNFNI